MLNPKYTRKRSKSRSKQKVYRRQDESAEEAKAHYPRISSPTSNFRISTKGDLEKRESIEVCSQHGANIVAFEEKTGETLCEACVYQGTVEKPVFMATVVKGIERAFHREHEEFHKLYKEFQDIDQNQVRDRIQQSISEFFGLFRSKIDELEEKTVSSIYKSKNLNKLIETLDYVHGYLEDEKTEEKYANEKHKLETKIKTQRFTYICKRKAEFDAVINALKKDNVDMASNIYKARSMIDAIFSVNTDEGRIDNVLNKLASDSMLIDEKKPDFGSLTRVYTQDNIQEIPTQTELSKDELIALRVKASERSNDEKPDYLSDQMNAFYHIKDNELMVKEFDGDTVAESAVMPLKLFLQKVITVPFEAENKVFLFGGSKDMAGKETVSNCYEVNLGSKTLAPIQKMNNPKLSMAAGISPDCKHVIIAGGSLGDNRPTNSCELFDINSKKWKDLTPLNCPRMSASVLICTGSNAYCFGGIESDPEDPSKFVTLKSIEWLDYSNLHNEWETLKINIPYKASSIGAICMGKNEFLVFGGWNRKLIDKSAYVWMNPENGY